RRSARSSATDLLANYMLSREHIVTVIDRAFRKYQFYPERVESHLPRQTRRRRSRLRLELFEDRALPSGNVVIDSVLDPALKTLPAPQLFEQPSISILPTAESSAATTRHELVIIDPRVPDWQSLVRDLQSHASELRQFEIVLLSPSSDGISQVSA